MNHRTATTLLVPLALLLSASLGAQQSVEERRDASPDARIEFSGVTGSFRFAGSDSDRLEITGTLGPDVEEMTIEGDADHWVVKIHHPRNARNRGKPATNLVIRLPRSAELEARAVSGSIDLEGLNGPLVRASNVSGPVVATDTRPDRLSLETVSGRIEADTGGRSENRIKTVSGSIAVTGVGGSVQVESVSGNLEIAGEGLQSLEAQTVSGSIRADIGVADRARLSLQSHSGDLVIALPTATPLDVDAGTFSGRIRSAFGGQVRRGRGPGENLEHRTGDGSVQLEAKSFSGSIRIEPQD